MYIIVVGVNHRSAPIEIRERLAFSREALPEVFEQLHGVVGLPEVTVLSTCNRVEIYAVVPELNGTIERLHGFLGRYGQMDPTLLAPCLYDYTQPQSVEHLFAVSSGLDSMVLGEHEILCQVKHAYEWAREAGATGKVLNALFQRAMNTAKAVRTQTAIGEGHVSIGSVAVDLAEKIFGRMSAQVVLLVGAGANGELALRRLVDRGAQQVRVLNRSLERAQALARIYGGIPLQMKALDEELRRADILISSVGGGGRLLDRSHVAWAMQQRCQRPLCLIDLGVPRNLDPEVATMENVYLFNIDDLQDLVARIRHQRQAAVAESRRILDEKVQWFLRWLREECATGASPS